MSSDKPKDDKDPKDPKEPPIETEGGGNGPKPCKPDCDED